MFFIYSIIICSTVVTAAESDAINPISMQNVNDIIESSVNLSINAAKNESSESPIFADHPQNASAMLDAADISTNSTAAPFIGVGGTSDRAAVTSTGIPSHPITPDHVTSSTNGITGSWIAKRDNESLQSITNAANISSIVVEKVDVLNRTLLYVNVSDTMNETTPSLNYSLFLSDHSFRDAENINATGSSIGINVIHSTTENATLFNTSVPVRLAIGNTTDDTVDLYDYGERGNFSGNGSLIGVRFLPKSHSLQTAITIALAAVGLVGITSLIVLILWKRHCSRLSGDWVIHEPGSGKNRAVLVAFENECFAGDTKAQILPSVPSSGRLTAYCPAYGAIDSGTSNGKHFKNGSASASNGKNGAVTDLELMEMVEKSFTDVNLA